MELTLCVLVTPKWDTLTDSEDSDEMPHYVAVHQGLTKTIFREREFYLENITCDRLMYTMDHPKFIVSNQRKESNLGLLGRRSKFLF